MPGRASSLLSAEELARFGYSKSHRHCKGCGNRCFLTAMHFPNGRQYVSGNRCERGAGLPRAKKESVPNLFDYKCRRLFGYRPLPSEKAHRGTVGVPRVMNMYENYPFWHTFLTGLGFRVVLSPKSDKHVYEKGLDSIPSEAICYPAKLAHGHIMSLIEQGIRFIFYPCAVFELKEFKESDNNFNCPVVAGYPEVIKINIDDLRQKGVTHMRPFISFREKAKMKATLHDCFEAFGVTKKRSTQPWTSPMRKRTGTGRTYAKRAWRPSGTSRSTGYAVSSCAGALTIRTPKSTTGSRNSSPPKAWRCSPRTASPTWGPCPGR